MNRCTSETVDIKHHLQGLGLGATVKSRTIINTKGIQLQEVGGSIALAGQNHMIRGTRGRMKEREKPNLKRERQR